MIQLNQTGLICDADECALRAEFRIRRTLRLPQLLHPSLLPLLHERMDRGAWVGKQHGEIGREVVLDDLTALNLLHFLTNTPHFLSLIRDTTECEAITRYGGRIYRMIPGTDHHDSWHGDFSHGRLVGMSINLGPRPYSGGVFQLRDDKSKKLLCELPNTGSGDAILFGISTELEHRVTPIEGTEPKTAFAGWFVSGRTDFFAELRSAPRE